MPTTQYPKNPNVETAFVTDDQGKRTRTVKTVLLNGTIDYPKNPNSPNCYVTVDGKKQRALMTADISSAGTLEFQNNSNSTKGYVTVNGKKQRVVLTAALVGGGSTPVIDELNVTPSTSAQTISATGGVDGYSPVNVAAVTSSIDANITSGNIKDGVEILGVTGDYKGEAPTGTMYIISNGTYNVADKAIANVNVPIPAHYIEKNVDANGKLVGGSNIISLTGVTDIGDSVLYYAYRNNTAISGVIDMSDLTTVSSSSACHHTFQGCTGLTSVDLSSLTTVSGSYACNYMFSGCTGVTSVDLSSLTTVSGQYGCEHMFSGSTGLTSVDLSTLTTVSNPSACSHMFQDCTGLTSVDLSALTTLTGSSACSYMFQGCTGLTSVDFPVLTTMSSSTLFSNIFSGCTSLTSVSFYALVSVYGFGAYTNQFNNMLSGVTGCTVHFPMAIQSAIGSWASVTGGFGGTNTTVLFDIVTTLTGADSNSYTRKQKDSTTTATAWTYNDTLYYTSGTTEPTVGATIYSDAACTTPVTTISSIA